MSYPTDGSCAAYCGSCTQKIISPTHCPCGHHFRSPWQTSEQHTYYGNSGDRYQCVGEKLPHYRGRPLGLSLTLGLSEKALGSERNNRSADRIDPAKCVKRNTRVVRCRNSFRRLCVAHISFHSEVVFSKPRKRNLRMPRASLIWPNTGSTVDFRSA